MMNSVGDIFVVWKVWNEVGVMVGEGLGMEVMIGGLDGIFGF